MSRKYYYDVVCYLLLILFAGCATAPSPTGDVSPDKSDKYIWPQPPATPRIQWIASWSSRKDFGGSAQLMNMLIGEEKVEQLRRPNGIVADSAGNVYVADSEQRIIFVFDLEKKNLRFIGLGSLAGPVGLAIDNKRGIVFVSDSRMKKVLGINKNTDSIALTIGSPGEFLSPSGLVYDENKERLYVSDTMGHVVKVYDKDGNLLFTIGKHGAQDGEFNFPSYLTVDKNSRLYVVDAFNFRVQIFDSEGKFIKKFGKLGDASGSFSRPHGIALDSEGHIYVVDAAFNNYQIFNDEGKLLLWIGSTGKKPGQFYLPSGMYIDDKDRVYVSDSFNRRIQVFQYLKEKI
jgi:DNA-binding beta-propeller fold protein YncE